MFIFEKVRKSIHLRTVTYKLKKPHFYGFSINFSIFFVKNFAFEKV